ncbi:ABC transporter ATP-binding protein [Streptomyces sp. 769]|uniref:ABC transporter ATP-binding protein n=1 Tax=Streptomyces sp. 769 TaxID=1262452 RepID=UPI000581F799|nr:ABC transporter ATP-binding protein [Streptomyces sp. 769]AJC59447.1 ABC transporter-like protein [Streptomyces sp. 769]
MVHVETMVDVSGLQKSYGGKRVVKGVDLQVRAGEVLGLLGPNGAGKTTTLECLVGLRRPTGGTVRVLGYDPAQPSVDFRRLVAVQPQEGSLFPQLTVRETVDLWASFYPGPEDTDHILKRVGLSDEAYQRVSGLSGGQRRRLLLAVTVVGRPQVLVLDEPAAGLDPQARERLWAVVREHRDGGGCVLLTTHDMTEASELCDRVAVLVAGRIVACDTPARLVSTLAATSTVAFTTDASVSLDAVRSIPGVTEVESTPDTDGRIGVRVRTTDGPGTLRGIAADRELNANDLDINHGSLEQAFHTLAAAFEDDR